MKKLKKRDFKKLALLGIAGGTTLATQAVATDNLDYDSSQLLAYAACGGETGSCHSRGGSGSNGGSFYQAYRSAPAQQEYYYTDDAYPYMYSDNPVPMHSCNTPNGCNGLVQPAPMPVQPVPMPMPMPKPVNSVTPPPQAGYHAQPRQPASGCGAQIGARTQPWQPTQPSSGCGSMTADNFRSQQMQPSQGIPGCNAMTNSNGQAWQSNQPMNSGQGQSMQPVSSCAAVRSQDQMLKETQPSALNSRSDKLEDSGFTSDNGKASSEVSGSLSESELMNMLNAQGKATYQSLDPAGKALALKMANQTCKGQNECKGLNSCRTEEHSCAGKGSCAGTASAPFKDKNLAVKVAAMKMAEKRANAASSK